MYICCQPLVLVLFDLDALMPILRGAAMELGDCSLPLVRGVVAVAINTLVVVYAANLFKRCREFFRR